MLKYDGIIIGNGIASHVVLYYLSLKLLEKENKKSLSQKLLILESPDILPCSLNSTSHAGTINARDGISPLGDMIKVSYEMLCQFIEKFNPEGIYQGSLYKSYDISDEVRPELKKTAIDIPICSNNIFYGHRAIHHFIEPKVFLNWFKNEYTKNFKKLSIEITNLSLHVKDITKTDAHFTLVTENENIESRSVLLTSGAELFLKWTKRKWNYPKLTPRAGDYLYLDNVDLGEESFSIMIETTNVIYRHYKRELLIGGTTNMPQEFLNSPNHEELKFFHKEIKYFYPNIPEYDQFKINRGIRIRGPKRHPFSGELHQGLFALIGLYKNGFTFPFLLAPKLADEMILKNFLK
jgi:hypothetical protein